MNANESFSQEINDNIERISMDEALHEKSMEWIIATAPYKYAYNFSWLGRPIIQLPQDIVAMQELIWRIKPDLIIETGIAHGGSLIFSASMLALIDYSEAVASEKLVFQEAIKRRVLGVDIDIRAHNRVAIEGHPLANKIDMIQGSSIDPEIIAEVYKRAANYERIIVCLDSNHTHDHVLAELEAYAPLTSPGSYCVVSDTAIEDVPETLFTDRPWGRGNNPKTAVWEYIKRLQQEGRRAKDGNRLFFEIDKIINNKLLITSAPDGYLRRVN